MWPNVIFNGFHLNVCLGQDGDTCLRSSDCAEGFCCARHFWSRICKPVLREGQVCTKHKRKGSHGLEIFQRCDCAEGLACRTQRGESHNSKAARSLHTCQRHWDPTVWKIASAPWEFSIPSWGLPFWRATPLWKTELFLFTIWWTTYWRDFFMKGILCFCLDELIFFLSFFFIYFIAE